MHWDLTIRLGELVIVLGVAWRAITALNRFTFILENFPPHRHVKGTIHYPRGLEPKELELDVRA